MSDQTQTNQAQTQTQQSQQTQQTQTSQQQTQNQTGNQQTSHPKIEDHPDYQATINAIKNETARSIKGGISKRAGFGTEKELFDFLKEARQKLQVGENSQAQASDQNQQTSTQTQSQTSKAEDAYKAKIRKLEAEMKKRDEVFQSKLVNDSIEKAFVELGGDPAHAPDVRTLIRSSNEFIIGDDLNLITESGLTPQDILKEFLEKKPIFKKAQTSTKSPNVGQGTATAGNTGAGMSLAQKLANLGK